MDKNDHIFRFVILILVVVIFFIIVIPWDKLKIENMTGGTLTQLFANDSQDVYLKSNVNKLATGNFDLFWNQPTRVANTFMNRGSPLPSLILPDTSMNPINPGVRSNINSNTNPYALTVPFVESKPVDLSNVQMVNYKPRDYLYDELYNKLLFNKDCVGDPASCGSGEGGFRLGEDFNQATKAKEFVSLDGRLFYPDSYVGSYFMEPNFDIVKPYPYMPNSNLPPAPIKMG